MLEAAFLQSYAFHQGVGRKEIAGIYKVKSWEVDKSTEDEAGPMWWVCEA